MLASLAKAAIYRPASGHLKAHALSQKTEIWQQAIMPAHIQSYHQLVEWPCSNSDMVHPNYVQVLTLPMQLNMMSRSPFPFKALGLVHIGNKINVISLPKIKDTLTLACYFGDMYQHRSGIVFEMHSEASINSIVAVKATSYYLARVALKHDVEGGLTLKNFTESTLLNSGEQPSDADCLIESEHLEFAQNAGRQYARVSGDYNPIHLWPATSRLFGYSKAIAHGMYSHALCLSKLQSLDKVDLSENKSIKGVFKQAITLPGKASLSAKQYNTGMSAPSELSFTLNRAQKEGESGKVHQHLKGIISLL